MTTYTEIDNAGAPVTATVVDSGVGSAPAIRASVFTPNTGYVAPASTGQANFGTVGNDWAVATAPTVRPQVFEPPSDMAVVDPGLIVSG